jgi:hypothetical protein
MAFAGLNYTAVLIAAAAGFLFGGLWYGALSKHWLDAAGIDLKDIEARGGRANPMPFAIAITGQLVMAWALAGVIGHLGAGQVTLRNGVISGLFVWLGFVATTLATNHAFQMQNPKLTLIDAGHWLGVLAIQGAVIGWMGVK